MKTLVITVLAAVLLSSCEDSGSNPVNQNGGDLVPMKAGNIWIYDRTVYDNNGGTLSVTRDTTRIYTEEVINGETWYKIRPDNNPMYWGNKGGGFWRWFRDFETEPQLLHSYPPEVGARVSIHKFVQHSENGKVTDTIESFLVLIEKNVSITTPAGKFSCLKYQFQQYSYAGKKNLLFDQFDYIAPGVGLVLQDWRDKTLSPGTDPSSMAYTRALVSYSLK